MSDVRIYRPSKTAMQSGRAHVQRWVLEFEPGGPKQTDPLMGWIGSEDTRGQVRLKFDSKEAAIAFAKKNGLTARVHEPKKRRIQPKNYADNFSYHRPF
ncbi:MAG: ETC complex I subunit [Alphaproteobacteria bacterium]|nr:ETC complex I subunit [Alphaproteobacteria bacterium]